MNKRLSIPIFVLALTVGQSAPAQTTEAEMFIAKPPDFLFQAITKRLFLSDQASGCIWSRRLPDDGSLDTSITWKFDGPPPEAENCAKIAEAGGLDTEPEFVFQAIAKRAFLFDRVSGCIWSRRLPDDGSNDTSTAWQFDGPIRNMAKCAKRIEASSRR